MQKLQTYYVVCMRIRKHAEMENEWVRERGGGNVRDAMEIVVRICNRL